MWISARPLRQLLTSWSVKHQLDLGLVSLDFIGSTAVTEYYSDYTSSTTTSYEHVLFVNNITNIYTSVNGWLAVDYTIATFLSIGFANYPSKLSY